MKPFGLTGNIGYGKSTIASLLAEYPDVLMFDSDCIAKEFLSSEQHREDVVAILGPEVIGSPVMNFKAVAQIIFADAEKKRRIEALIHPLVWKAIEEKIMQADKNIIPIVESALLYEINWQDRFAAMIVAACSSKEQYRRLKKKGMNDTDIRARKLLQLPQEEKEGRAQFVIHTDCTMEQLKRKVAILYQQLKEWKGN